MTESISKSEISAAIEAIAKKSSFTQAALASVLGVDQAMVSRYLKGTMKPSGATCLVLAGLSTSDDERRFWIAQSGLGTQSLNVIARALSPANSGPIVLGEDDVRLLRWFHSQAEGLDKALQDAVRFRIQETFHQIKFAPGGGKTSNVAVLADLFRQGNPSRTSAAKKQAAKK